jgi:hypothetical protein
MAARPSLDNKADDPFAKILQRAMKPDKQLDF